MGSLDFEGRRVPISPGDTIASALFRDGLRTFSRSIKYHRRRGLYCLTGDCPNCIVTVDEEPGVRSCSVEAREGQRVVREMGWPSAERDVLAIADRLHRFLPVGFYYKTFVRPRSAWPIAEKLIRRATGVGSLPTGRPAERVRSRTVHIDALVVGGGVAGLAAAAAASDRGDRVLLCDDGAAGPPSDSDGRVRDLRASLRDSVEILDRTAAIGVYEGPIVPLVGPDGLVVVHPERVILAAGAVEHHPVFPGNDLPGVWLGRGAARMARVHGVRPARRAVVAIRSEEGLAHVGALTDAGVEIAAVLATSELVGSLPSGLGEVIPDGRVVRAVGRKQVTGVDAESSEGVKRHIACDGVVVSLGLSPRDALLRMGDGLPVIGAGDVVTPGCSIDDAARSGALAGRGEEIVALEAAVPSFGSGGYVCLCEDVSAADLESAWREGWTSSEILKRYTTATMGPCQGAMCGRHLARFTAERSGGSTGAGARTTARPPARSVALEELAACVHEIVQKRSALHERHLELGARVDWSGSWMRPYHYGDAREEYRAVRERVSVMDVSTLGKFLIAGPDATELLDRVFPCRMDDIPPGRSRYLLALDEAGYVMDDGLLSALPDGRWYITTTSGGADRMEAWLRNWADRWASTVHIVNQTSMLDAINVAGPHSRELLQRLTEDPIDATSLPYPGHREIVVAGVPCRAIRVGFVGELSFELHHPRSRSGELWDALLREGADLGIRPHGLDALEVLRLEKGHMYLGQDTLPDDHPLKLGLGWAVAMDKPSFLGRLALERMSAFPLERKLVGLSFDGKPQRGAPLASGEAIVGRITSCSYSGALDRWIGLGWMRAADGVFPETVSSGEVTAVVVSTPFYDPKGERVRA